MIEPAEIRALLLKHGTVCPQRVADWGGPFALPDALSYYYEQIGPAEIYIPGYGNPFFLPALRNLWTYQAGYRWNGVTNEPISDWPDDWLVVADNGADPFIFSRSSGMVLFAYHGEGDWEADPLFSSVTEMAACLSALGAIVKEAGDSFTDKNSYIAVDHKTAALSQLTHILGNTAAAEDVMATLGWG